MNGSQRKAWYANPYVQLGITAVLVVASEIFLKKGAVLSQNDGGSSLFGIAALAWGVTWLGIALQTLGFLSWLAVLRVMPLVEAFSLIHVVQVLIPIGGFLFLNETISWVQAGGILMIVAGTVFVAGAVAAAEERL